MNGPFESQRKVEMNHEAVRKFSTARRGAGS